jgi:hypothetical protein
MTTQTLLDEIAAGQGIYLSAACRLLPSYRRGRPVTPSCLVRWVLDGVRGPDGQRVLLEAARVASKWVTTRGAIARFVAAQTPRLDTDPAPAPTPTARHRAAQQAAKQLEAKGI